MSVSALVRFPVLSPQKRLAVPSVFLKSTERENYVMEYDIIETFSGSSVFQQSAPWCRITQTRAFDTESAGSSHASGFIVDAKRGLILTNRHVVSPGMFTLRYGQMTN